MSLLIDLARANTSRMGLRMTLRLKMTVLHIDLLLAGSLPSIVILLHTYTVI